MREIAHFRITAKEKRYKVEYYQIKYNDGFVLKSNDIFINTNNIEFVKIINELSNNLKIEIKQLH